MGNKHISDKSVGIFLLAILSFIFTFKYEYIALAFWPAVAAQFPVLEKKGIDPSLKGYKQMNQTSLITYGASFAISVFMLVVILFYRKNINFSLLAAVLASVAHEAIMLTFLIPFVYDHRTDKRAISWGLYGVLTIILGSLSKIWLSNKLMQNTFAWIIFPLIIIGSIIHYNHFAKKVLGN